MNNYIKNIHKTKLLNFTKISIFIFLILSLSRFVPHPPNFTSLIALSFYVPIIFGTIYIPIIVATFVITDFFIGFHSISLFTWISVIIIGIFSKFFVNKISNKIFGLFLSCLLFFIVSNLGVWLLGQYGYSLTGLFQCFILAIPFFGNTILSTFIYAMVIEMLIKLYIINKKIMI